MPVFKIQMRCQLENVKSIEAPNDDFQYSLKIKCNGCNEVSEKWHNVSADEKVNMPSSRGHCNFLIKCKLCTKVNSLNVLLLKKKKYLADDVPCFKEIIAFECRGLSVVGFRFGEGWKVLSSVSRKKFEEVNLDEEWFEYDEDANEQLAITEIEHKII